MFQITRHKNGGNKFCFHNKSSKKNMFTHAGSAKTLECKYNSITNEDQRIAKRCSNKDGKKKHTNDFYEGFSARGCTKPCEYD